TADLLARRADRMGEVRATLSPALIVLGATGVLLMMQPDLGTAIVTVAIVMGILFIAGTPLTPLAAATALMAAAATFLTMSTPYRRARVLAFLHPSEDPLNRGWQTLQSLVGIASGGLAGVGLGASRAKWGFLPEAHTDFIFAIIGEELGFVGCLVVVGLFVAFGMLGLQIARRAPDRYGMLVAAGVTTWVLVQAFVNMGAVVGLLPITGLPLPFVSFGGSALITTMAATGLLLNIARQGSPVRSRGR
ncbi:MAG TPA: FtsW/RodA/SpoVE family cell cycle protein, partial [Acidimicrobiales bacterium]|nr:FtsW/RodA/SpoVE family cell cycle protein [Acidimicrobiales bacterium]